MIYNNKAMYNCKFSSFFFTDDNIDETYGVNVQFESDEEVNVSLKIEKVNVN